ncbi:MAG: FAD-dependent oxidoreductase, partial [Nostocoides sp.]
PAAATRKLVQAFAPAAATTLAAVESASVAVVTFAFAASELPPPTGSGFLVPPIEGRSIKASTNSSSKWGWLARQAPEVTYVRASLGRHLEEATLQRPDAQLAEIARRDLGDILGRRLPVPVDWHVQRWGGGLPQYAVGHVERIELVRNEIATFHGLEVAGAAYDGVGIPAVIGSGRRAARALAEAAGLRD